jgi:cyanophycinase
MIIVLLLVVVLLTLVSSQMVPTQFQVGYKLWCIGNCDNQVNVITTPGAVLMGGGTDVEQGFYWQIKNANRGDFLILRTSGDDAYNPWVYNLSVQLNYTLNSVTTILFRDEHASNDVNIQLYIKNADAIFFAGGDQSVDLAYWTNTPIQTLIQQKVNSITIGGTSAGLAILGGKAVYSGGGESVTSEEALENPYNSAMVIVPPFVNIPFLESVITDTHFVTRDRMGRLLTFIARIYTDSENPPIRGIGVNESTALLLDYSTGSVQTVGTGSAYICNSETSKPSMICENNVPLSFHNISCHRLIAGNNYSFVTWSGDGITYQQNVVQGTLMYPAYD